MNHLFFRISIIIFVFPSLIHPAAETKRKRAIAPSHPTATPVYTGAGHGPAVTSLSVPQSKAQAKELAAFKDKNTVLLQTIRDAAQNFVDSLRKDPATGTRRISYAKDLDALKQHLQRQFRDQLLKIELREDLVDLLINQQAELALAVYKNQVIADIEQSVGLLPEEIQELLHPFIPLTTTEIAGIFGYRKISHTFRGNIITNQQDFSVVLEKVNTIDPLYRIYTRDKNSTHYTKNNFTMLSLTSPIISNQGNVVATFPNQHSVRLFRQDKNNWVSMGDPLDFSPNTVSHDFSLNAHGSLLAIVSIGEDLTTYNVIIYRYTEGQWIAEHTIHIPNEAIPPSLHISSDNSADVLLVALLDEETKVYSKKREGNWELDINLPPGDINQNGSSIIINEQESDNSYSYQRQGTTWTRLSSTFYIQEVSNNGLVALLFDADTNEGLVATPHDELWQQEFKLSDYVNGMNSDGTMIFTAYRNGIDVWDASNYKDIMLSDSIYYENLLSAQMSNDGVGIIINHLHSPKPTLYMLPLTVYKLSFAQQNFLRDLYKAWQEDGMVILSPEQEQQFKDLPLSRELKRIAKNRLNLVTSTQYQTIIQKRKKQQTEQEKQRAKLQILQELRDSWAGI